MITVQHVRGFEILDSRGNPTVAAEVVLSNGARGFAVASESKRFDASEFVDYLGSWVDSYPIVTIEDAMAQDDWDGWDGWELLTAKLGRKVQLVGDDLFVTNTEILQQGIERGLANSILIKANQIGTLTGDACCHCYGRQSWVFGGRFASLWRDGGHDHCRSQRMHGSNSDQDRFAMSVRPHDQVQPLVAHRSRVGSGGRFRRAIGYSWSPLMQPSMGWRLKHWCVLETMPSET